MRLETAIAVLGAGGHAKVVIATLRAAGLEPALMLDDNRERWGGDVLGVQIVGPISDLHRHGVRRAVLAVGDNRTRCRLAAAIASEVTLEWPAVVHPAAIVHSTVRLGPGTVVFAGAIIQPDAAIGAHGIVNTAASIDHDAHLGDCVHVAPGVRLASNVVVGDGALLGIGCRVLPGRRVGVWSTVGAGAAVTDDVGDRWTVVGSPARRVLSPGA
jgi:UDP-perosamine 4-acetyltransferase